MVVRLGLMRLHLRHARQLGFAADRGLACRRLGLRRTEAAGNQVSLIIAKKLRNEIGHDLLHSAVSPAIRADRNRSHSSVVAALTGDTSWRPDCRRTYSPRGLASALPDIQTAKIVR